MYQALYKIKNTLSSVLYAIAKFCLILATALVVLATIIRYTIGISYEWVNEIIRYLAIAAAFFLSGPMLYDKGNVNLDIVVNAVKNPKLKKIFEIIYYVASAVVALILLVLSVKLFMISGDQVTYSLVFPLRIPYSLLPIGMFFSLVFVVLKFILKDTEEKLEEEEEK